MKMLMVNLITFGGVGLLCLCLFGCSSQEEALIEESPRPHRPVVVMDDPWISTLGGLKGADKTEVEADSIDEIPTPFLHPALIEANTRFACKLLAEVYKQDRGQNILISPISVSIALTMTYNGALGETQQAMAETLEFSGLDLQTVNRAIAALQKTLITPAPKFEIAIANSIWVRQGFHPRPDFLERNRQFFSAKIEALNFADPKAPVIINGWVSANTKEKIKEIVPDPIPGNVVMILINAIYFKGRWKAEFDKAETRDEVFHLMDGTEKQVPMMSRVSNDVYFHGDSFDALNLPYGDGQVSLYIFLPRRDSTLDDFISRLNAENWERWMSEFDNMAIHPHSPVQRAVEMRLPRFKIEYDATITPRQRLNEVLIALGMGIAFTPGADFGGIEPGVYIDLVKHKTFIEVNEEGTEAAGVTAVFIVKSGNFEFVVDRPFFFAIRDNVTKTVLFMGIVIEPK